MAVTLRLAGHPNCDWASTVTRPTGTGLGRFACNSKILPTLATSNFAVAPRRRMKRLVRLVRRVAAADPHRFLTIKLSSSIAARRGFLVVVALQFSCRLGLRNVEKPTAASRRQILDVNWLFLLINQEASTDNIAVLCITMQD